MTGACASPRRRLDSFVIGAMQIGAPQGPQIVIHFVRWPIPPHPFRTILPPRMR